MKIHLFAFPAAVLSSAITGALSADEPSSFKEQVKHAYLRYVATSSKDASSVTNEQWEELDSMVSEPIIDTSPETFLADCIEEFNIMPVEARSNWQLIVNDFPSIPQESAICMESLYHIFKDNNPNPDATTQDEQVRNDLYLASLNAAYDDLPDEVQGWIQDTSNPRYNVPTKALFPRDADDVVASVKFAKKYGVKISIKNSGHSFTGSSTRKGTLLLNMRKFERYAAKSITECDPNLAFEDFADQPCRLAIARGKLGYIRVGGGENWGETYKALDEYNDKVGEDKFFVIGGEAATVSPFGWTMQTGLGAQTGVRQYGFGADQVLQVEMVLADGNHVLFGPSEWTKVEGKVPQTTAVKGVCKIRNEWTECPEIPFADIWRAVRGGGGGWGVVLSFYLQLHPDLSKENVELDYDCAGPNLSLQRIFFLVKYLHDPTYFEEANALIHNPDNKFDPVTVEDSNKCGANAGTLFFECNGAGAGLQAEKTWAQFLRNWNVLYAGHFGEDDYFTDDQLESLAAHGYCTSIVKYRSQYQALMTPGVVNRFDPEGPNLPNIGAPEIVAAGLYENGIIPRKWLVENDIALVKMLLQMLPQMFGVTSIAADTIRNIILYYGSFGVAHEGTSDGMDAVSAAQRKAGFWANMFPKVLHDAFFTDMYGTEEDNDGLFPGYISPNHSTVVVRGPLKDDWGAACPSDETVAWRNEHCFSLQEAIFGTTLLKELELIKEKVDPDGMFTCAYCIGDN